MFTTAVIIIGASALISYLTTPFAIRVAKKYKLMTDVSTRTHPAHTHTGIIPRGGGIPIFISLLVCSLIFLPMNKIVSGILIANAFLLILGLLDDKYDVSPYLRFIMNLTISTMVVGFGLGIPFISNPFGDVIQLNIWKLTFDFFGVRNILILADILAVVWLSWMMNMVNWSKGVDGQLPGFVAITALFLGILSQRFVGHDIRAETVMILSFIVSGAYLGFLPFNFFPQRIMPGYGGGSMAGFLLGVLSILSFGKVGTAILVLAIPMIDAVYTIIRRLRHKKSPFRADWGHFHHRLIEIGWGKRRIAVFYWTISLILGITSLFLSGIEKFIAFITVGIVLVVFIIVIDRMKKLNAQYKQL
ncbi:undecaprenyl/decaprenyl-phosphate alpha-N-acetylglucosaminyl 1-phosphate transferase [Candidatus Roizmanbacteria bacterium]|nr:MAG: undecaprenyl/decaprenyl-phosphate alpha-N-acetylglucosaminyl 1-phosphate transferase [Candidatus Roizmanbacteria bacterium]